MTLEKIFDSYYGVLYLGAGITVIFLLISTLLMWATKDYTIWWDKLLTRFLGYFLIFIFYSFFFVSCYDYVSFLNHQEPVIKVAPPPTHWYRL